MTNGDASLKYYALAFLTVYCWLSLEQGCWAGWASALTRYDHRCVLMVFRDPELDQITLAELNTLLSKKPHLSLNRGIHS